MCSLKEATEEGKPTVPFIYKGYRLYSIQPEHFSEYVVFMNELLADTASAPVTEDSYEPLFNYYLHKYEEPHNRAFMVYKDGKIVGHFFIIDIFPGKKAFITLLELLKEHRNKGIGTGLMNVVETLIFQAKCSSIGLIVEQGNERAIPFYQRLGYVSESRSHEGHVMFKNLYYKTVRNV